LFGLYHVQYIYTSTGYQPVLHIGHVDFPGVPDLSVLEQRPGDFLSVQGVDDVHVRPPQAFTFRSFDEILLAGKEMGMAKRALWSRILGIIALILIVVGYSLISGGGRRLEYGSLMLLGIILAATGAFLSRSSGRKLVLWGAGVYAATWIPALAGGVISALKGGEPPVVPPIIITITVIAGILSLLAIVVGTIGILLGEKQPAPPPSPGS
jgi:hypothetical protein